MSDALSVVEGWSGLQTLCSDSEPPASAAEACQVKADLRRLTGSAVYSELWRRFLIVSSGCVIAQKL